MVKTFGLVFARYNKGKVKKFQWNFLEKIIKKSVSYNY